MSGQMSQDKDRENKENEKTLTEDSTIEEVFKLLNWTKKTRDNKELKEVLKGEGAETLGDLRKFDKDDMVRMNVRLLDIRKFGLRVIEVCGGTVRFYTPENIDIVRSSKRVAIERFHNVKDALVYLLQEAKKKQVDDIYKPMLCSVHHHFFGGIKDFKEFVFKQLQNYRNSEIDRNDDDAVHLLFGVSGSGKSRITDELCKMFYEKNVLAITISYNFMTRCYTKTNFPKSRFISRLLYSLFRKSLDLDKFSGFENKCVDTLTSINNFDEAHITWKLIMEIIIEPLFTTKVQGCIIFLDELLNTDPERDSDNTPMRSHVHPDLYRFLSSLTSTHYTKKEISLVYTIIDINKIAASKTRQSGKVIKSYKLPLFSFDDWNDILKEQLSVILDGDAQLELYFALSQGRPRVVELLLRSEKLERLDNIVGVVNPAFEELIDLSFISKELKLSDQVNNETTVSKCVAMGLIYQPKDWQDIIFSENDVFEVHVCILSIMRYFKDKKRNQLYQEIIGELAGLKMVHDGRGYESFHSIFLATQRDYWFRKYVSTIQQIDNRDCISLKVSDLFSSCSYSHKTPSWDDTIYLPRFTERNLFYQNGKVDFKDYEGDLSYLVGRISMFKAQNQGFDSVFFGYDKNKEVAAFFCENKYTHDQNTKTRISGKDITDKHVLLKDSLSKHPKIKTFYHIFFSFQYIVEEENIDSYLMDKQMKQDLNNDNNNNNKKKKKNNKKKQNKKQKEIPENFQLENIIVFDRQALQTYYGPSWSQCLSFFGN